MQDINKNLLRMILSVLVSAQIKSSAVQFSKEERNRLHNEVSRKLALEAQPPRRVGLVCQPVNAGPGTPNATPSAVSTPKASSQQPAPSSYAASPIKKNTPAQLQKMAEQEQKKCILFTWIKILHLEVPQKKPVYTPAELVCVSPQRSSVPIASFRDGRVRYSWY